MQLGAECYWRNRTINASSLTRLLAQRLDLTDATAVTLIALVGISIVSKISGFAREAALAASFGTSRTGDTIFAALLWPNLITILAAGITASALTPVFITIRERDGLQRAVALARSYRLVAGLSVISGSLLLIGLLPQLVRITYPSMDDATRSTIVDLGRILAVSPLLALWVSVGNVVLNAARRHRLVAALPIVNNLVAIAALLLLNTTIGAHAVAVALFAGLFAQIVVQRQPLPVYDESLPLPKSELRDIALSAIPILGITLIGQLSGLVDQVVVAGTGAGNIAVLGYANRLNTLPAGLISDSVALMLLPRISRFAALGDFASVWRRTSQAARVSLVVLTPAAIVIVFAATPITTVSYMRGLFDQHSVEVTSTALRAYALGLPFIGFSGVLMTTLWALRRPWLALWTEVLFQIANVGATVLLTPIMGVAGPAIGTSTAFAVRSFVAWRVLRAVVPR